GPARGGVTGPNRRAEQQRCREMARRSRCRRRRGYRPRESGARSTTGESPNGAEGISEARLVSNAGWGSGGADVIGAGTRAAELRGHDISAQAHQRPNLQIQDFGCARLRQVGVAADRERLVARISYG